MSELYPSRRHSCLPSRHSCRDFSGVCRAGGVDAASRDRRGAKLREHSRVSTASRALCAADVAHPPKSLDKTVETANTSVCATSHIGMESMANPFRAGWHEGKHG